MVPAFDKTSRNYAIRYLWHDEFYEDEFVCEGNIEMDGKKCLKLWFQCT